jgi:hemerythrin-like domain-containing protein
LLAIANLLEKHISFEDSELFPYLESNLKEQNLIKIRKTKSLYHQLHIETYKKEF